jgi:hypothetical protein
MRGEVIAGQPLDLEAEFAQPLLRKVDLPVLKCYAAFPTGHAPAASADPSRWVGVPVRKELNSAIVGFGRSGNSAQRLGGSVPKEPTEIEQDPANEMASVWPRTHSANKLWEIS